MAYEYLPNGTIEAVVRHTETGGSRPYVCVFHTDWDSGGQDLTAAIGVISGAWEDNMLVQMDDAVTFEKITVTGRTTGGTLQQFETFPGSAGTGTGAYATPAVAALYRKSTGGFGASARGRLYLPKSLAEADIDDVGNLDSAAITSKNSFAASFLTDLISTNALQVVSRSAGTPTKNEVLTMTVDEICATQRRRQRK